MIAPNIKPLALAVLLMLGQAGRSQEVFQPMAMNTAQALRSIHFSGNDTGYVCGDSGTLLRTLNGGTTWSALDAGTNANLWDIEVIPGSGGQGVIAVGDDNTIILSQNAGANWTASPVPFAPGSFVFGVQCMTASHFVACGGDFATFSGAVLTSLNGGASWTSSAVPASIFLDKILMIDGTTGYAVGSNTSFSDGSIQRTVNGTSFSPVYTSQGIVNNVAATAPNNVVAVGLAGQIRRSTNGGSTWADVAVGTADLYGITFAGPLLGYACGGPTGTAALVRTMDGGATWTTLNSPFAGTLLSACTTDQTLYLVGEQGAAFRTSLPVGIAPHVVDQAGGAFITPDPWYHRLRVTLNASWGRSTLRILDLQGRLVLTRDLAVGTTDVDIAHLPDACYAYQCIATNGRSIAGRFVVE